MNFDLDQLTMTKFRPVWDKITLATTSLGGFIARQMYDLDLNDVYLILAICVQAFTIVNICVYLLLNYRRILINFKRLFTFRKKKKKKKKDVQ
jgi:uncharacterized membrane protein